MIYFKNILNSKLLLQKYMLGNVEGMCTNHFISLARKLESQYYLLRDYKLVDIYNEIKYVCIPFCCK